MMTPHFSLAEMTRTGTGLPNTPGPAETDALRALCEKVLEPLRAVVGPLKVTSGYRSPAVNAKIGGSKTSQHNKGEAADLIPVKMTRDALLLVVVAMMEAGTLPVDQCITYTDHPHLHLSYTTKRAPRKQVLVGTGGKYAEWKRTP